MINNLYKMFLGSSPSWYKNTIIAFLIFNPIALYALNSIGLNGAFFYWMAAVTSIHFYTCPSIKMLSASAWRAISHSSINHRTNLSLYSTSRGRE
jgi:hypothetical protein